MAENDLIVTCKNCSQEIHYLREPEKGMGYIECPKCKCSIDQEGTVFVKPAVTPDVQNEINKLLEAHKQLHISFEINNSDNYYDFQNYYDQHETIIKALESRNTYHESREDFLDDYVKFLKQDFKHDDSIDTNEILQQVKSFKLKDPFVYLTKNNSIVINSTKEEFEKTSFLKIAVYKTLRLMPRRYWGSFKFLPKELDSEDRLVDKSIYELNCLRVDLTNKNFESAYSPNNDFIKAASTLKGDFLKQAQISLGNDSIYLGKFFANLQQDHYIAKTVNLISADFIDKDFPVYVSKFINGTCCEIHKDGDNVTIYSNKGEDLTKLFLKVIENIKALTAQKVVLNAVLCDDKLEKAVCAETFCHIYDILYYDKDIHKYNFSNRKNILDSLGIKRSSFEPSDSDYYLNKSPYILCKNRKELENAIERISKTKDYYGVTIHADTSYNLKYQQPGEFIYSTEIKKSTVCRDSCHTIDETLILCDFLNCEIKDIYMSVVRIPGVEAGNIFNAIEESTKKFTLVETRNFSGYEIPPIYQEIRLKKNLSRTFLIEGTQFYYDDLKNMPLIIQRYPTWGGYQARFITHVNEKEFNSELTKHISIYAHENNFLKNEKFSVSGEFLDEQTIEWEDLKLTASIKDKLKKLESLIIKNDPTLDSRGLIFIGPPGCGKTLTGKLLSKMAPTFIWVTAKDCSEMGATYAFSTAFELARELRPTILFMEDIDSYIEYGMIDLLKTELDGMKLNNGVFTILTSNFPEKLPEALIDRPGRFHDIIYFTLPNPEIRKEMLTHFLKETIAEDTLDLVVGQTEGFSGAHIKEICNFAKIIQKEDNLDLAQAILKSLEKLLEQRQLINDLRNKNRD